MKTIVSAFLFLVALIIGLFFSQSTNQKWTTLNNERTRQPSSTPLELKDWNDLELMAQIKHDILSYAKVIEQSNFTGIELKSTQLNNSEGQTFSLCDELPHIAFEFTAEGIQYSNGNPSLLLEGRCNDSEFNTIEPVYVDLKSLSLRPPQNETFVDPQTEARITLNHLHGEWPPAWSLSAIYFQDNQGQTLIHITLNDFIKNLPKPLGLIMPVTP